MQTTKRFALFFLGLLALVKVNAQEIDNYYQSRVGYTADIKVVKKLHVDLSPEFRMNEEFYMERFLMESGIVYSPFTNFSVSGYHRFIINNELDEPNEYLHRFMVNASYKLKLDRWRPYARVRYSGFTDVVQSKKTLRYKAGVKYNLKGCKFSPNVSFELFHLPSENVLYKYRTSVGGDYKLNKKNYISAYYKFEFFKTEYVNRHIFQLAYKMKF